MTTPVRRYARLLAILLLVATAGLWSPPGLTASDCGLGLTLGTQPTIDGQEAAGEWSDATVLNAASPCFGQLMDYVAGPPETYLNRQVTVKSKRYQVGTTWMLGFLFEVQDLTSTGPCSGGKLCIGEKIIMQFNRVIDADTKLTVGQDKRFTLTHKWSATGNNITDGAVLVDPPVTDASCTAVSGVDVQWGPSGTNGITFALRNDVVGGGYRAEVQVPVSFVTGAAGALASDIGVAFAVVNDFGKNSFGAPPDFDCTVAGTCEGAGLSFPASLPETNDANPVDAICDLGWVIPKQWGIGYLTSPPAQVTISRLPVYWSSNGIDVFECDSTTPSYTYYRDRPCKARIRANLRNTGATTRRKVVYLWAKHGTGDPAEYNFVDFKQAIVSAGTPGTPSSTLVESLLWSGMPKNQANHPCLRVYIFPDSLSAADEAILRGTTTGGVVSKTSLDNVVMANGVEDQHWAQKNISGHDTITQCPNAECRVAFLSPDGPGLDFIDTAIAQDTAVTGTHTATHGTVTTIQTQAGKLIPAGDLERYARDHVIVRLRAVAYRVPAAGRKPLYSFIEDYGGVVQLFPVAMVKGKRELPLEFQVSNASGSVMRVKVLTDTYVPSAVAGVNVKVDRQEFTLQPRSEMTVKGGVQNPNVKPSGGSICKKATKAETAALGTGVLLVGLVGLGLGRRRRR